MSYYYSKYVNDVIDKNGVFIENYELCITEDIILNKSVKRMLKDQQQKWIKYFSFVTTPEIKLIEISNTGNDLEKLTNNIQMLIESNTINDIKEILPNNIESSISLVNFRLDNNRIISDVVVDEEFKNIRNIIMDKFNKKQNKFTVTFAYQINLLNEDTLKIITEKLKDITVTAKILSPRLCFYNSKCTHYPII